MVLRVGTVMPPVHMVAKTTKPVPYVIPHAEHVMVKAQMNVSLVGAMRIVCSQINLPAVVSVTTIPRVTQIPAHLNVLMAVLLVDLLIARIVNFVQRTTYF